MLTNWGKSFPNLNRTSGKPGKAPTIEFDVDSLLVDKGLTIMRMTNKEDDIQNWLTITCLSGNAEAVMNHPFGKQDLCLECRAWMLSTSGEYRPLFEAFSGNPKTIWLSLTESERRLYNLCKDLITADETEKRWKIARSEIGSMTREDFENKAEIISIIQKDLDQCETEGPQFPMKRYADALYYKFAKSLLGMRGYKEVALVKLDDFEEGGAYIGDDDGL